MDLARLRNFGIVAHIDAGKTTVSERILFYTGVERRMGEVHDGNTALDWMEEERERGITITAATTQCPWRDHVLQLIDTPGHVDFSAEVNRSLRVLDGAVVVLCAVAGVQAQTETVLRQAARYELPWLSFVNKMDRPGADFESAVRSLRERLQAPVVPVQIPAGSGPGFEGVVDLIEERLLRFSPEDEGRTVSSEPIPEALREAAERARTTLCEAMAETREDLLDLYLEHGRLEAEVLRPALREAVRDHRLVPALCGAALRNVGIQPLLDGIVDWLPSPLDRRSIRGHDPSDPSRVLERAPDPAGPVCLLVFKLQHDRHGDLCFCRIYSGTLREGDQLHNARHDKVERVQQIWQMHADEHRRVTEAGPGAIVVLPGLKHVETGDTLFSRGAPIALQPMEFPAPVIRQTVEPRSLADRDRLLEALHILDREDPTLHVSFDEDSGQAMLSGMGELHLEVALHRLERDFRIQARTGRPLVAYRETLAEPAEAEGRAERPQGEGRSFVRLRIRAEPAGEGQAEVTASPEAAAVLGPAVLEGLQREAPALLQGSGSLGYPLQGLRVRILEVESGPGGDSPPLELVLGALSRALEQALEGRSLLLEPIMALHVEVPEDHLSGVLADLNSRGAEMRELVARGDRRLISASAPLDALFAWSTQLRSLTQGRGTFTMEPEGYAPVPESRRSALLGGSGH